MRDFSDGVLVTEHLLSDEADEPSSVSGGVRHFGVHVHLVTVTTNTASKGRVHALDGIKVASSNENKVTRNGFGLGQGTAGALGATRNREGSVLHSRQQSFLPFEPKQIDFIDVKHALVGTM